MKAKELLTKLRALNDAFEGQERKEVFTKVLSKAENVEYESAQELYDLVDLMGDVEGRPKKDKEVYEKLKEKPTSGFTSQVLEKTYKKQLWHDPLYRVKVLENKISLFEEVLKEILKLIAPQVAEELERKLSSAKKEEVYYVEEEEEEKKDKKEEGREKEKKEEEEEKKEEEKEEEKKEDGKEEGRKEEKEEEEEKEREDKGKEGEGEGEEEGEEGDEGEEDVEKEDEEGEEDEESSEEDEEDEKEDKDENDGSYHKKSEKVEAVTPGTLMPEDFWADITSASTVEPEEEVTKTKLVSYEEVGKPLKEERSPSFYFGVGWAFAQEESKKEPSFHEERGWTWEKEEEPKEEYPSFLAEEKEKDDEEVKEEKEDSAGGSEAESGTGERKVPVGLVLITVINVVGFLLVRILGG